ncbi:AraC family transcriptional regulator [Mucilaginibacter ginsenosidivorax]|uniref:AraC family transcriptional regulator n=1 Tax=Mucilaginibacter ginsenosidivorax TaxID=862126 RepID=A0A5B8VTQ7_9SPHI|nr:AraC family transcriptional regulator [Mucilaginibacter ginsenosidivorax]QEC74830.1 AraC family transcriptional regulator [Mucilaginibacter ginsenosidivorax]
MNHLILQQGKSKELAHFPHILEFAHKKNNTIQLNSFNSKVTDCICLYYILEGKFTWIIDLQEHTLYPGDFALVLPGQCIGGESGILNIGVLFWIKISTEDCGKLLLGKWSGLTKKEKLSVNQILLLNRQQLVLKLKEAQALMHNLQLELQNEEVGFYTRVNQLLDELFVLISRQLIRQNNSRRDFPQTFLKLEQTLRQNLAHQWTVEEMAALIGMGTTAFTEKVKHYSGFSPLNYLINIRITEATKLLKKNEVNVTDIALSTGFYSSQHFSTTFKKLTGYTPSEFRKNKTSDHQHTS